MKVLLYRFFIELTNHNFSSSVIRRFSLSSLSKYFLKSYGNVYKLNMDEAEKELHEYRSLHDLFTRKLKAGIRPIADGARTVVSPVDAVFEDFGPIRDDKMIEVKGKVYSIEEMLGDESAYDRYAGGQYMVLYLSPSHYHRIHAPVSGKITKRWTLGGRSYPVNKWGMTYGKAPLSKNYRVITEIKKDDHSIAVVKVGAMFVNSIEISNPNDEVLKGEEMAYFSFGSTIVLLFQEDSFSLKAGMNAPYEVKLGESLGTLGR